MFGPGPRVGSCGRWHVAIMGVGVVLNGMVALGAGEA